MIVLKKKEVKKEELGIPGTTQKEMSGTNLSATTSMAQNIPGMPQAQPGVAQVIFKIIQINSNPKQYLWIKLQRILGLANKRAHN